MNKLSHASALILFVFLMSAIPRALGQTPPKRDEPSAPKRNEPGAQKRGEPGAQKRGEPGAQKRGEPGTTKPGEASATKPGATKQTAEKNPTPAPTTGVRFDSGNRRDPFINLLSIRKKTEDAVVTEEPTLIPPGIAGMKISEIQLSGTSQRDTGFTAVVRGTDKRTYFLREGDRLFDGFVQKIERDGVQFVHETKMRSGKVTTQEISKRLRAN